ncbi:uncharacterized protein LOC121467949 [Drosophila elegans]|uniref:uncharacterized protein LOC121467949 n=1 Tax=Drosophila elegans TaxID=30023 RepID=UPI001BC83372|nr:uncharacterized protein LOC121467949 [Drosophila elegans]
MSRPPAVRERKPGIGSNPQFEARRISTSKTSDSEPSGSRKYLKSGQTERVPIETQGRNNGLPDNGYDAGLDTVDANDYDRDEMAIKHSRDRRRLNSFVYPEPIPSNRLGGFLRALARSLHHCSMRIAAGFGLSRQQAAWYKNCWNTRPDSQPKGINLLCTHKKIEEHSAPNLNSKTQTEPRKIASSTTL